MSDVTFQPSLPTGTITFLFTDLEGSTRLWEEAPTVMRTAMARHDALIEGAVAERNGVIVRPRGEGDSRFAVFPRAVDAVAAAAAMQRALAAEPWQTPFPLRVRIALHTGEADVREGDYYGTAVNRCARLRSAGHGGQTLVSETTYALVRDSLPEGVTLRDMGEHRLRDLRQPERIYQLVIAGLPSDFAPLRSLESFHTNLPTALTSFIGREQEMAHVKGMLGVTRLLTIVGPGGAGKTRLGLQVCADLLEAYRDGVWLIELAPVSEDGLIAQAVANSLGIREEAGRSMEQTLLDFLRDRTLLLLLDNCEHVIQAAAKLAEDLLRSAPGLRILATSREPLHVGGEMVWNIPSLSLPTGQEPVALDRLTQYEAVRLFVERASAVRSDFTVTNENAAAVARICRQLDGIPLAIELAAARIKVLSAQEIAARLDDRFRLLVGGSRTALPRQRTLRALVDWSYDLLSEKERLLLNRLSVFIGGFTLDAAEKVAGAETSTEENESTVTPSAADLPAEEVLDLLTALVDKSLVIAETEDGTERYRMLETIRQYAGGHLVASHEADEIARRHTEYYAALAKLSYAELWGPRQEYWLPRLELEHDNIAAALEWAARDPARAQTLLFMTSTLWRFWEIHGHLSEGRAWLEKALALTDDAASLTPRQKWYRANALRGAGNLVRLQGDYDQATALHAASFTLFREVNDRLGIARELDVLGEISRYLGDYARALDLHNASLAIRRELGDKEGIAASLGNLGVVAHDQGDNQRAWELLEESLKLNRERGDRRSIALSLSNLGLVAHDLCDYARATALYEESVAISRELQDRLGISFTLQNLGNVAKDQGELPRANDLYNQCLTLKQELGDKRGIARALGGLAEVAFYQGEYVRARQLAGQSLDICVQLGVKRGILLATNILAFINHYQGDDAQAEALTQGSLKLAGELGTRKGSAFAYQIQGLVAYARGNLAEAEERFQSALQIFKDTADRRDVAYTLVNLARTAYRRGDLARARSWLNESLAFSREVGNQWGIAFALEINGLLLRHEGRYAEAREPFQESLRLSSRQANRQGILNCLGALAGLAMLTGNPTRAARLFGAAEQVRKAIGATMVEFDRVEYENYLTRLEKELSAESLSAAWKEGCALTLEQAMQEALAV